jgi:GntR family transcriptional repressor for pyruvate dehydrogenase complex
MFYPYRSKRAFEDVADQLQRAILNGRVKNGERLPSERIMSEQFQAGRLTVREALRTLETKGLIRIKKGSGGGAYVDVGNQQNVATIIVDNLSLEGLTDLHITEARVTLECAIVRSAAQKGKPSDLIRLLHDLAESKVLSPEDDPRIVIDKMINFHLLLAEASQNPPFIMFIRALMEWARRKLMHYSPTSDQIRYSYRAHMAIFKAVEKKDVALAQSLMKKHIERMGTFVSRSRSVNRLPEN